MANYEIMLIVDPKENIDVTKKFVNDIFSNAKIQKLDQNELAYEINNSKTAQYLLINTEANAEQVKEFTRKVNITKTIWRHLLINMDNEKGREFSAKKIGIKKPEFRRNDFRRPDYKRSEYKRSEFRKDDRFRNKKEEGK